MKIYLVGVPGFPNYGDELIFKNWIHFLKNRHPDAEIWIDTPHPTIIHTYFPDIPIKTTNTVWRLAHDCYRDDPEKFATLLREKITRLGTPHYDLAVLNLKNTDFFHIIGGGYINKLWKNHIGILHIARILKQEYQIKTYATGMGFLPLLDEKDHYRTLSDGFDYCESRDKTGSDLLGIIHGCDDAYLNQINQAGDFPAERIPDIMVCIQHDTIDTDLFDTVIRLMWECLAEYRRQSFSIGYIEAIPGQDRFAFEHLQEMISEDLFFPAAEAITCGLPVKPGQVWYSSRFHHHLIALLIGLKGVAISMNKDYYNIKHRSLLANGTGWGIWDDTATALPYPALSEAFTEQCMHVINQKRQLAASLYPVN